jgi:hypothetical protein
VQGLACELSSPSDLAMQVRETEWHFGHSGKWPRNAQRRRPRARRWVGEHGHLAAPDVTELRARPRSGHLAECRRNVSANDDLAFGRPVTSEFRRSIFVLGAPKLARNQIFTARCVPNMYLFGTFSAQNTPEIAPQFPPCWGSRPLGTTTPHFRRYDAPPRAAWRNTTTSPPATPPWARWTPKTAFRAAEPPKQFGSD